MVYMITYDLHGGVPEDYTELLNAIKNFEHCPVNLQSSYLIKSDLSAEIIGNKLSKTTDKEFSLIVIEITNNASVVFPKRKDSETVKKFCDNHTVS